MSGTLRFVAQLHKGAAALDAGDGTDEALRAIVPPVHFSRRSAARRRCAPGRRRGFGRAMEQLAETALNVRRTPALGEALTQRALLFACHYGSPEGS